LIYIVGFFLLQIYNTITDKHGDKNSIPKKLAATTNQNSPNIRNIMNSAGLFLKLCFSNMLEYLYSMKKSNMTSTLNSPKKNKLVKILQIYKVME
jgi:hypothetical protein